MSNAACAIITGQITPSRRNAVVQRPQPRAEDDRASRPWTSNDPIRRLQP